MAYPIQWLDATFSTRSKTEELLRPDLEAGLISSHDYQLAATFLPGTHRYWPHGYAILGSTSAAGYAQAWRRPPASLNRTTILATVGGFCGAVYGQFRRAKAHWTFTQLLEDPVAFSQALENVNQRTGGPKPLAWTLQRAQDVGRTRREDPHGNTAVPAEDTWAPDAGQVVQPDVAVARSAPVPNPQAASNNQSKPASRWEEIRAVNARNAGQSTWDALRQSHERGRMKGAEGEDRPSEETDRSQEQVQFDALLEAERKRASR